MSCSSGVPVPLQGAPSTSTQSASDHEARPTSESRQPQHKAHEQRTAHERHTAHAKRTEREARDPKPRDRRAASRNRVANASVVRQTAVGNVEPTPGWLLETHLEEDVALDASLASHHRGRAGVRDRDYAIRIGVGFRDEERRLLQRAAAAWRRATGLPLSLRSGYGPTGSFHMFDELPSCDQQSVYDGLLGCYNPTTDVIVLNRPAIRFVARYDDEGRERQPRLSEERRQRQVHRLMYLVFLHELGHWLGLPHAERGRDSVMLPDLPSLELRILASSEAAPSEHDVDRVCTVNDCAVSDRSSSSLERAARHPTPWTAPSGEGRF